MKKHIAVVGCLAAVIACSAGAQAPAPSPAKKALVQRFLQAQQGEIENLARVIVERPAAVMLQEAGSAIQRQVPPDKREQVGKQIEAEVKKYSDEALPIARERAAKIAPTTIGAVLEEKLTEDELKQLVTWLESPTNKKFQQLGNEMRSGFVEKLVADVRPLVDPKVQALDGRIRVILGVPLGAPGGGSGPAARPPSALPRASAPR